MHLKNKATGSLYKRVAVQDSDEETVTMSKESFYNLMEILRMQMLMNSSSQVGSMDL